MNQGEPKATVLVADDHEHVREALAMMLRGDGYHVCLCSSPQEAVSIAERQSFDIALLDMNYQRDSTSGLEGLGLIERLRKFDSTLPIVALTAWGNVELAVKAMTTGANDFVEKPWRNQSLLEKVSLLTQRARATRSSQKISEFERQDAQKLQTRIVPARHVIAGDIEVYGESVPAGVVGGDYFGVWQPTSDSLHLCIADVSGKGTPGALIAAMLYASVSTLSGSGGSPDMILREVEHLLQQQLSDSHYVTIVYAALDVNTRTLSYVNAGHCPPYLLRGDGQVETLSATRAVLGLGLQDGFDVHRIRLKPGDRLAFYTDGITEAANGSAGEFGNERLVEALRGVTSVGLREQHHLVLQQARTHATGDFTDDATLVLTSVGNAASLTTSQVAA
jgi:sigma-B regulation protein RsbU (phosphoserine phosphatase)